MGGDYESEPAQIPEAMPLREPHRHRRDWYEWAQLVAALLLPVAIAGATGWYSYDKDRGDVARQEWGRDSDYVRLLASSNTQEQAFAREVIRQLRSEHKFPADLVDVVNVLAAGRPSDPITQRAALTAPNSKVAPTTARPQPSAPAARTAVYIQYAATDQFCDVRALEVALGRLGFATPSPELVGSSSPSNTEVRYFSTASLPEANRIATEVKALRFNSSVKDYRGSTPVQLRQIEVWLGKDDNPHILADAQGNAITDGSGNALLDSNCDPFVIGKSPVG